jgi:hypothetical protein
LGENPGRTRESLLSFLPVFEITKGMALIFFLTFEGSKSFFRGNPRGTK